MPDANLMFLGPPGSGKGTQAVRLADALGLVQLSSGDALRRERKRGSPVGQEAARYMDAGTLVPDDVIMRVMLAQVDELPPGKGFILDGIPRTVPQAEALDRGLAERGLRLDAVVDFDVADAEIIRRVVNRRVCGDCGATYNLASIPPRVDGVCDRCGKALVHRPDDREEGVATRLSKYHEQTEPLIEYYRRRGLLVEVDAARDADAIYEDVLKIARRATRR